MSVMKGKSPTQNTVIGEGLYSKGNKGNGKGKIYKFYPGIKEMEYYIYKAIIRIHEKWPITKEKWDLENLNFNSIKLFNNRIRK